MVKIFGKYYYIDIDAIANNCAISETEINVLLYDTIRLFLDTLLTQTEDEDIYDVKNMGIPFMIAFNTLINYEILIEDDEENE